MTLEGETTRPTSERAKEAIFSSLQFEISGRTVLDLFAGSGQMALEALSRGAAFAVLVDASPDAVRVIEANVKKTRMEHDCRVVCADYAAFLKAPAAQLPHEYDLIILDPPYAKRLIAPALRAMVEGRYLGEGALIVCESDREDVFEDDAALKDLFSVRKTAKYGVAYVTILEWKGASGHE